MPANLGEFEQLVLLALLRLGGQGYGVTVQAELGRQAGRSVSLGTVYKTLLPDGIRRHWSPPTWASLPRSGAAGGKKHYAVTLAGRKALQRSLAALRKLSRGLDAALDLT